MKLQCLHNLVPAYVTCKTPGTTRIRINKFGLFEHVRLNTSELLYALHTEGVCVQAELDKAIVNHGLIAQLKELCCNYSKETVLKVVKGL